MTDQRPEGGQQDRRTRERPDPCRCRDQKERTRGSLKAARHPVEAGRVAQRAKEARTDAGPATFTAPAQVLAA